MKKALLFLLIFSTPFTAWFAVSSWLRFPVVIILIVSSIVLMFLLVNKIKIELPLYDFFLFLFLISCLFSSLLNASNFVQKDINNLIAIFFIVIVMYFLTKIFFTSILSCNELKSIPTFIVITYYIVAGLVFVDFLLKNSFDFEIYKYFIIKEVGNATYFFRAGIWNPAGPAEEPAYTAFFLNILYLLSLSYKITKVSKRIFFSGMHAAVLLVLGSTAGIFFLVVALLIPVFVSLNIAQLKWFVFTFLIVLILSPWTVSYLNELAFFDKLSLDTSNLSANLRLNSWIIFFNSFSDGLYSVFFGHTPGFSKLVVGTGFHSTYFTFIANFGLISFIFFALFLVAFYIKIVKCQNAFARSVFWLIILNNAIGDYFYQPIIWLTFIIITVLLNTSFMYRWRSHAYYTYNA